MSYHPPDITPYSSSRIKEKRLGSEDIIRFERRSFLSHLCHPTQLDALLPYPAYLIHLPQSKKRDDIVLGAA